MKLIVLGAKPILFELFKLNKRVFAVKLFKKMAMPRKLHPRRDPRRNQILEPNGVDRSALHRHNIPARHNADVRHKGRCRHSPAVAQRRNLRQYIDKIGISRLKGIQHRFGADRHSLLKIGIIVAVERDGSGRTYLCTVLTHRAVVIIHLIVSALREAVGVMIAGLNALLAVYAFFRIPHKSAFQRMDFVPCAVRDAAHRNILARAAEAAGPVSLDMGKIDEKIRIVDQSRNIDVLEFFKIDVLRIKILSEITAVVEPGHPSVDSV